MISQLNGLLVSKNKHTITVLVAGIGFEVHVSSELLESVETGQEICLHTRLIIRDDGWSMYGFINPEDRVLFDMLMTVHGIGPRIAIGILSSLPVREFYRAVLTKDEKTLIRLPGIGKKTAARIIVELRDKIGLPKETLGVAPGQPDMTEEAVEALLALGYSRHEAQTALSYANKNISTSDLEILLREALKHLARF